MAVVARCAFGNDAARLLLRAQSSTPFLTCSVSFVRALETRFVGAKPASACGVRDGVPDLFVPFAHSCDGDPDVG